MVSKHITSPVAHVLKFGTDILKTGIGDVTRVAMGSYQMFQDVAQPLTQGVSEAVQNLRGS